MGLDEGLRPEQQRARAMLGGPEMLHAWQELVSSLRSGRCAWELAHGVPVFEYYAAHPDSAAVFDAAMTEHTRDAASALVAAGEFSRFRGGT